LLLEFPVLSVVEVSPTTSRILQEIYFLSLVAVGENSNSNK